MYVWVCVCVKLSQWYEHIVVTVVIIIVIIYRVVPVVHYRYVYSHSRLK